MRYPPSETAARHEKILSEASRLFREQGFSAVSVKDLMEAAGLSHGSFYNHFDSKQHLISECLAYVNAAAVGRIVNSEASKEGRSKFVAGYLSVQARDDPGKNCLMSSLGPEVARDDAARPAMTRYVRTFIDMIASHFRWPRGSDHRKKAIKMTASMVGALVLARALDDDAFSKEILTEVIAQLSEDF